MTTIGNNNQSTGYYDADDSPTTGGTTDGGYTFEDLKNMGFSDERAQRFIDRHSSKSKNEETTQETVSEPEDTSETQERPTSQSNSSDGYTVDELIEMGIDPELAEQIVNKREGGSTGEESESEDDDSSQTQVTNSDIDSNDKFAAEDLENMGLDADVAAYITEMFGHKYGGTIAKITGKELKDIIKEGNLNLSASGMLSVKMDTTDGYNIYELLQETELTQEEAEFLIYEASNDQTLTKADFKKYVAADGTLSDEGKRIMGDKEFEGNPVDLAEVKELIDENAEFDKEALQEELGMSPEVSEYITSKGPVSGSELVSMIENRELKAGKVDDELQVRAYGSTKQIPPDGLAMPALIVSGLSQEEAQWLMDSFGLDGKVSEENIEKYLDTSKTGGATLNDDAKELFELGKKDIDSLLEEGATRDELVAMGFSDADAKFLIGMHGDKDTQTVPKEKIEELQSQGFIVDDPSQTDPQKLMLQGEDGMSADDAAIAADDFAKNTPEDKAVVTIAKDGTGNFFAAGTEKTGPAANVDIQKSVVYSRERDDQGNPIGDYTPSNGNDEGLFNRDMLKDLGYSQEQADAIFEHTKNKHTNDEVPDMITMSELRTAVKDNVANVQEVSEIVGQSVVMRVKGEPKFDEQDHTPSPFSPTQQEAQWLNENYGGGDGLLEAELAHALEDGIVQIKNDQVIMTGHGKSMAFADLGPTGDLDQYNKTLVRRAFMEFDPNGTGNDRTLDLDTMMDTYNGSLSEEDANLILECFGSGDTISQDQMMEALKEGNVIMAEKPADSEGSKYSIKITPHGYESMAASILENPDNSYYKQIDGILNYPGDKNLETINLEQLQENHKLSKEDAFKLVSTYDRNGDGHLERKELLTALLAKDIEVSAENQITKVNLAENNNIGPYTVDELASKIKSEDPPAKDLANAIFLDMGIDPGNSKGVEITDEQVEAWLRDNTYMSQNVNGEISIDEAPSKPDVDDVWNQLTSQEQTVHRYKYKPWRHHDWWPEKESPKPDGDPHLRMPHNDRSKVNSMTFYDGGIWDTQTTLSRGETYQLADYMNQNGMGYLGNKDNPTKAESKDLLLTKDDIKKLVEDGIIGINGDGLVELTPKGRAELKAKSASDSLKFFDKAEDKGDVKWDDDGNRYMSKDKWTDGKNYQDSGWTDFGLDKRRDAGYEVDGDGTSIMGLNWSLNEGWERVVDGPQHDGEDDTIQHETIHMDETGKN
ncbi:MAG: hypothetical protein CMD81_07565 [Gammaproteobacteria bacterium]|nr:hypothetical protein [Gammaproteobacteria bacterium]